MTALADLEVFASQDWNLEIDHYDVMIELDIYAPDEGETGIWISRLRTDPQIRRRGYARQLMENLCSAADDLGITLFLSVVPYERNIGTSALRDFYVSLDFEDFDFNDKFHESGMIRRPQVDWS